MRAHARACAVRLAMRPHGVKPHLNTTRPLQPTLNYAGPFTIRRRNLGGKCFVNTALAYLTYGGVA